MNYCIALFDMDGTVLDTLQDLSDSVNHVLRQHGMPLRSVQEVRSFVGGGVAKLIERSVPTGTPDAAREAVLADFKAYYKLHCADLTRPYDGIPEMLHALRAAGVKTAVISNKADPAVQALAKRYFDGMFDFVLGERPDIARKPAPDSVYATLDILGLEKADAVYIGDSDVDVATAKNSGVDRIAVTWGFRSEELLKSLAPEYIIHKPEEIVDVIVGK